MKRKLLFSVVTLFAAVFSGGGNLSAQVDVTESYIGDVTVVSGNVGWHGSCSNNHKESDGKGWWNNQTISGSHAFNAPNTDGGAGESWSPAFGSAGVMMGRTMVLPAGNYTLSFEAFACNATNSEDPETMPAAGDAVTFLTGKDDVDITNTANAGDNTFHNVSFTFDVTTDNTAFEFGVKKLANESKIDWCQIKNVTLTLNSDNVFPVPNNNNTKFFYSGEQAWRPNTWSTEGQWDGSRFQVPFHELWVDKKDGTLSDATITASFTPTESGVYKVSAWVRAVSEAGNDVTGVKIFVGDAETDACTGSSVISGKGRLGTYTAMADGVAGTSFNYGFIIDKASINWLSFKNVVITYLGELPAADVEELIEQANTLLALDMDATVKDNLTTAKNNLSSVKSVANYNALVTAISDARASADAYALFVPEKTKALALGMTAAEVETYAPNVKALKVAEYNFVNTNYAYGVELGTWTAEGPTGSLSEQHWSGEEKPYLEQSGAAWNSGEWSISYSQDLNLPAGNYVFKVAGRKNPGNGVTMQLLVKNGETVLGSVNDFPEGGTGRGITKAGATQFDGENDLYANGGAGWGFEWRYVKFTLAEAATVNVAVKANATASHQWVSFCDATVLTDNEANISLITYNIALNGAQTLLADANYANVGGTDESNLVNDVADDATLDKTDKTAIETATAKLNADAETFKAGVAAWNAYALAKGYGEDINSTVLPYATTERLTAVTTELAATVNTAEDAETAAAAINTANRAAYESNAIAENVDGAKNRTSLIAGADGTSSVDWTTTDFCWLADSEPYTEADGNATNTYFDKNNVKSFAASQTIQLPAGNYILSVTARAQSGINSFKLKVTNNLAEESEVNLTAMGNANGVFGRGWNDFTVAFSQESYGDAVISIEADNTANDANLWMSWDRLRLYCIGGEGAVEISENATYTPVAMENVNVKLTRTIKASPAINTLVLPFSMTADEVTTIFGPDAKVYKVKDFVAETGTINFVNPNDGINANEPCLLTTSTASTAPYVLSNRRLEAGNPNPEANFEGGLSLKGSYEASTVVPQSENNFVLSNGQFYTVDSEVTQKGTRFYFSVDTSSPIKALNIAFDDEEATAIANINSKKAADGAYFNMAGQRVGADYKGFVIKNGKKVLVK
ncbi:MAG: hypothetical protein IKN44_07370 [Bacteroidaceae bacterium]|nr:hypothetical protein [Bacteroidaceae bacterium]